MSTAIYTAPRKADKKHAHAILLVGGGKNMNIRPNGADEPHSCLICLTVLYARPDSTPACARGCSVLNAMTSFTRRACAHG
eukprot:3499384-Prymnesium_polylepis.1